MVTRYFLACHCKPSGSNLRLFLLLPILLFGCRPATPPPGPADLTQAASASTLQATSAPVKPTSVPKEFTEVRNAKYELGAANSLQTVQLTDGKFEQGSPGSSNNDLISVTMTDFVAVGDLNADGSDEVAPGVGADRR